MKSLTIAALLIACLAAPAVAAKLKVPKDYSTIQAAVNAAAKTDVIEISKGVYPENVVVNGKSNVKIRARGNDRVTIDGDLGGGGVALHLSNCGGIVVRDIRVRNSKASSGIVVDASEGIVIRGCRVSNVALQGIAAYTANSVEVRDCEVENTGSDGVFIMGDDGVVSDCTVRKAGNCGILVLGEHHTVAGNLVQQAGNTGIRIGGTGNIGEECLVIDNKIVAPGLFGIFCDYMSIRCTVADNEVKKAGVTSIHLYGTTQTHYVDSNVLHHSGQYGIVVESAGNFLSKNVITKPGKAGFSLWSNADSGYLFKNKVSKAGVDGFQVNSNNNMFIKNKATKSKTLDLNETKSALGNTYIDNDFKKVVK